MLQVNLCLYLFFSTSIFSDAVEGLFWYDLGPALCDATQRWRVFVHFVIYHENAVVWVSVWIGKPPLANLEQRKAIQRPLFGQQFACFELLLLFHFGKKTSYNNNAKTTAEKLIHMYIVHHHHPSIHPSILHPSIHPSIHTYIHTCILYIYMCVCARVYTYVCGCLHVLHMCCQSSALAFSLGGQMLVFYHMLHMLLK